MRLGARLAAALAALLLGAGGASAASGEVRGGAPGDFDLYLLALSWSPGFCAAGGADKAPDQCGAGAGLGFVVHGLWPQSVDGYPTFCKPPGRFPSRSDIASVRGVMPSDGLARSEWRKHGTCSGMAPSAYFSAITRLDAAFVVPDTLKAPTQDQQMAPLAVERALVAANPGLRTDMMATSCVRADDGRQTLEEVRVCFSKDLKGFTHCPDDVLRGSCHASSIVVPHVE